MVRIFAKNYLEFSPIKKGAVKPLSKSDFYKNIIKMDSVIQKIQGVFRTNTFGSANLYPKIFASLLAAYVIKVSIEKVQANKLHNSLVNKANQKRLERDAQVLRQLASLPEVPQDITILILKSNVVDLLTLLNEDKITSEQILLVYFRRAASIGLENCMIAESNLTEALETARSYDKIRANTPKEERLKLGNLFGIPICIKDSMDQKGLDSLSGMAKACFQPYKEDGAIIKLLRAQGAIPFIRSNTSQLLRAFDCSNNVWGRGLNPWNSQRSLGGSSGGDGGLIAAKCSPICYGSDAYGSIRLPAAFAGVYGFKPTSGRYCQLGHSAVAFHDIMKFSFLTATTGPIGRCTDDLVLLVKGLITPESRKLDPSSPYVEWNEGKFSDKKKLKIGFVTSEDFFGAAKPCRRAVLEAVAALRQAGHEVIETKIPNFEEICLRSISLLASEGEARSLTSPLEGEKPVKGLELFMKLGQTSNIVKRLWARFTKERTAKILQHTQEPSANELVLNVSKLCVLRGEVIQSWAEQQFDAVIMPPVALPAFKHDYGTKLLPATCYLWLANIANLPAGVVPVTTVKAEEANYTKEDSPKYIDDILFQYSQENMADSVGLPVGVQVLSLPWEDEKCLAVMKEIETLIGFKGLN